MVTWRDHVELSVWWGRRGADNPDDADWNSALWDAGLWAGSEPSFIRLTDCEIQKVVLARGRNALFDAYPAGTLSLTLNLAPDWEAGPIPGDRWSWRSDMSIGDELQVRVKAKTFPYTGVLYRGDIRAMADRWSPYGIHALEIQCTDLLARLGRINLLEREPTGGGERSGARIHRLCDLARIPTTRRRIDTGLMTLQATNLARNLAGEAEVTATSEGGDLFCDRAGNLIFLQRMWWRTNPLASEEQAIWTNVADPANPLGVPVVCPVDIKTRESSDILANVVELARAEGTVQTARDTASMSLYGPQTYARSDLMNVSDSDVASLAAWRVAEMGQRVRLIDGIQVNPMADPEAAFRVLLAETDLGYQHRLVWDDGDEVTDTRVWVQGTSHEITPLEWKTSLRVWDRYTFAPADGWDVDLWDTALWADPLLVGG